MSDFKEVEKIIQRNKVEDEKDNKKVSNRKDKFIDDGRSIADMNIEGFSWHTPNKYSTERKNLSDLKLTRKERMAMILGALQAILPIALMMILLFFGVFLLISFWLS
jgi:hypothetical protein